MASSSKPLEYSPDVPRTVRKYLADASGEDNPDPDYTFVPNLQGPIAVLQSIVTGDRADVKGLWELIPPGREVNFINAASQASMNFVELRETLARAKQLSGEIATAAERLAKLLDSYDSMGLPGELDHSLLRLLGRTKSLRHDGRPDIVWEGQRFRLGAADESNDGIFCETEENLEEDLVLDVTIRDTQMRRSKSVESSLRSILSTAPALSELLKTLAEDTRCAKVGLPSDYIAAGTKSRQRGMKTDYLRAFGEMLTDSGVTIDRKIARAMAMIGKVVIESRDGKCDDINPEEVLKALGLQSLKVKS